MSGSPNDALLSWLRAAGEPTRLRLLALCAMRELSVSDIAQVVGQSEPRVSRHLKILGEAGLIERVRQGQWVNYGLTRTGAAAAFVQGLLGQLDRSGALLSRDRERAQALRADGLRPGAPAASRLGRELRSFVESVEPVGAGAVLVVGAGHPELIETAAAMGGECTVLAHSRRASQAARALAERDALRCRVVLASGGEALGARDLGRLGQSFAVVLLDRLETPAVAPAALLALARRALLPGGRLLLFERYEALEGARGRVVEHPLARLRRLLGEAGLACERLSPIEADGQHVLAAVAVPAAERPRGAASAA
ncbi:MAG TPA: metalloregulator ArsR/SmtB family transcription factor [Steroidobacteraceae bacterium]|nr:metalloregulator ArsR/SmtB family transcription factor [Steroidobacteraceae bacterium]